MSKKTATELDLTDDFYRAYQIVAAAHVASVIKRIPPWVWLKALIEQTEIVQKCILDSGAATLSELIEFDRDVRANIGKMMPLIEKEARRLGQLE